MFTVKIFRKELGQLKPAYETYEASFQHKSAAEIYAVALETNVSAFQITIEDQEGMTVYKRHWGCPKCFDRKDLFVRLTPNPCDNHKMCPQCHRRPISLDSHDLKEYGYCKSCCDQDAKRLAPYYRKEYEYVFGSD
jgi:hypothetical protein